jgi:tripartite-type tricarboxylate transporter receptor subunit TctC
MFGGATLEGGINGRRRSAKTWWAARPDTPTFDEAGVPGLHASFWHGLWAPRGTPKDVIATLHAAVLETLADPSVRQRFATDVAKASGGTCSLIPIAAALESTA